jgi:hypothetical protein
VPYDSSLLFSSLATDAVQMMSAIPEIGERCESSDLSKVFREPDTLRVEKDIPDITQVFEAHDIFTLPVHISTSNAVANKSRYGNP